MRKIIVLVLSLTFLSVILFGCQSKVNTEMKSELEIKKDNTDLISKSEIKKISISKSNGFGKVNPDFFTVFDDEKDLKIVKNVLLSANKELGSVDMAKPKFDLEVTYKNKTKQGLHLWLGAKGKRSTLMDIDDTSTIYTVLEEMTDKLIYLIQ